MKCAVLSGPRDFSLAAPLTPYITVGAFIVLMMSVSALASLTLLPALIKTFRL